MQSFAIIPAAGRSQRMGQPKLLLPWGERTIIEHVLGVWRASRVTQVVLIVHPQDARLAELGRACGAVVVQPADAPREMKVSVQIGLAHVARSFSPRAGDAWLLAPADMPTLTTAVIDQLIDAYQANGAAAGSDRTIWAPVSGGRRGHPVLLPWALACEVDNLAADEGLNALVARFPVEQVEVDGGAILDDLDTPEDYDRLQGRKSP